MYRLALITIKKIKISNRSNNRLNNRWFSSDGGKDVDKSIEETIYSRLDKLGFNNTGIQKAVVKELSKNLSKSELKTFPDAGLSAMVDSILSTGLDPSAPSATLTVSVPHHKTTFTLSVPAGTTVLDAAKDDVVLGEYIDGTCGGTMSCSTCHVYVDGGSYEECLPDNRTREIDDAELDMLDLAAGYREGRSRLGCQVKVGEKGMKIEIPEEKVDYWT